MTDETEPARTHPHWRQLMETLTIGAICGMADAHAKMEYGQGETTAPLNDMQMFDAAVVLSALVLEAVDDRTDPDALDKAAGYYRQTLLDHLRAFRQAHERTGEPALFAILERAGVTHERRQ